MRHTYSARNNSLVRAVCVVERSSFFCRWGIALESHPKAQSHSKIRFNPQQVRPLPQPPLQLQRQLPLPPLPPQLRLPQQPRPQPHRPRPQLQRPQQAPPQLQPLFLRPNLHPPSCMLSRTLPQSLLMGARRKRKSQRFVPNANTLPSSPIVP